MISKTVIITKRRINYMIIKYVKRYIYINKFHNSQITATSFIAASYQTSI